MLTTSTASSPTWPRIARSEEEAMFYNHCQQLHVGPIPFPNSMYNRGGDKEFPFLQDNDPKISHLVVAPEVPNFHPVRVQSKNGRASHELTRPASSDCAFSLLSLPATQFSGISLAQLLHTNATPPVQTISSGPHWFNNLAQHSCSQVIESMPISPVLVPVDTTKANDHCNTMFHMGSSGLSENEPSWREPFSWLLRLSCGIFPCSWSYWKNFLGMGLTMESSCCPPLLNADEYS